MAGKKKTRNLNTFKKLDFQALKKGDVLCPICRTILIEPVSLPCNHAFCKVCFQDTMENANLVCPLCRTRVGSWYRRVKKENRVVDEVFWSAIQDTFPQEVQNKYDGVDSGLDEEKPVIVVADPGEIRKEYEIEKKKEEQERQRLCKAEEEASETLIQKIKEEEEYRQVLEEEKCKFDALLAKKLAKELLPSTSKQKKTPKRPEGPMDKFICNSNKKTSRKLISFTTKEYTSGVLCLDKFPKSKNNGTTNPVMPVVQKKIKQIHKILETEEQISNNKSKSNCDSASALDIRYYFKPIEIFTRSPEDRRSYVNPTKIPGSRAEVKKEVQILPPAGKVMRLQRRPSAFVRFSEEKKSLSDVVQKTTSKTSENNSNPISVDSPQRKGRKFISKYARKKPTEGANEEESQIFEKYMFNRSKNNNILNFNNSQRKISSDSPFSGFDKQKPIKLDSTDSAAFLGSKNDTGMNSYNPISVDSPQRKERKFISKYARKKPTEGAKEEESQVFEKYMLNRSKNINNSQRKTSSDSPFLGFDEPKPIKLNSTDSETFLGFKNNMTNINPDLNQSLTKTLLGFDEEDIRMSTDLYTKVEDMNGASDKSSALDNSLLEPFLGFVQETKGLESNNADSVNNSITESFHGFDNSDKNEQISSFNGLRTDVSPEIQKSSHFDVIKKSRPNRVQINGLTQAKNKRQQKIEPLQNAKKRKTETSQNSKKRKLQEEADFQLAIKLQFEFDQILAPKRTRRGTTRQATLDELATFW